MEYCPGPRRKVQRVLSGIAAKLDAKIEKYGELEVSFGPTDNDFYKQLGKFLPRSGRGQPVLRKRLRDAEFRKVTQLCEVFGRPAWSLRPRTFVVLYMIGHLELMDEFVNEGLFDISLPYTANNLPAGLTGEARITFLQYQDNVLTGQGPPLERPGYEHQHIHGSADDLFIASRLLGKGGSAVVDRVMGRMTGDIFARKRIRRDDFRDEDQ